MNISSPISDITTTCNSSLEYFNFFFLKVSTRFTRYILTKSIFSFCSPEDWNLNPYTGAVLGGWILQIDRRYVLLSHLSKKHGRYQRVAVKAGLISTSLYTEWLRRLSKQSELEKCHNNC